MFYVHSFAKNILPPPSNNVSLIYLLVLLLHTHFSYSCSLLLLHFLLRLTHCRRHPHHDQEGHTLIAKVGKNDKVLKGTLSSVLLSALHCMSSSIYSLHPYHNVYYTYLKTRTARRILCTSPHSTTEQLSPLSSSSFLDGVREGK